MKQKSMVSRREFIRNTSIAGGGLIIGLHLLESCVGEVIVNPKFKDPLPLSENVFHQDGATSITDFLQIRSDGSIFVALTKYEMGQGVSTGLSAIIAEELEADWSKINIRYAEPIKDVANITGGSTSILSHWDLMRKAGAFAKSLLMATAAKEWSVYVDQCLAQKSVVQLLGTKKTLGYGQLAEKVVVPENYRELFDKVPLKYRSKFNLIGNRLKSKIIPDIVLGKHPYSIDLKIPGLKYAAIARCPVFMGSLKNYDDSAAINIRGVEKVVPIKGVVIDEATHVRDGIAVIANSTWAAFKGKEALVAEWDLGEKKNINPERFEKECYQLLEKEEGRQILVDEVVHEVTDYDDTISHTYEFPYQHHACMEPLNATAQYHVDSCEIWVGTQSSDKVIGNVEKHFGIPKENVKVHCHPSGGGFGLRYSSAYALEALMVSEAAGGDLVKMCYSREDDIKFDYLNPFELNKHTIQIKEGRIIGWNLKNVMDNWGGLSAWLYYDVPNRSANEIKVKGFTQMGAWRSVMANAEGFSTECFIDEVALALNRDPLEFRLSMLPANKMLTVNHRFKCNLGRLRGALLLAARKANWGVELSSGSGKGIAAYPYMHGNGYGAAVTDVSIKDGTISVDKVTLAIDCGLVVNPDLVIQQMEGGIIWAISAIFYGGTDYKDGSVQRSNFHDNKVLRINEIPEIEVHICENDEPKPWGVGEIAGPVTYASVCNAIYAATGKRIRKLPIDKELKLRENG